MTPDAAIAAAVAVGAALGTDVLPELVLAVGTALDAGILAEFVRADGTAFVDVVGVADVAAGKPGAVDIPLKLPLTPV
jgi:hypothetical protein